MAPWVGFEPTTTRLTVEGSTIELPRNNLYITMYNYQKQLTNK
jgi:hypothetical protein